MLLRRSVRTGALMLPAGLLLTSVLALPAPKHAAARAKAASQAGRASTGIQVAALPTARRTSSTTAAPSGRAAAPKPAGAPTRIDAAALAAAAAVAQPAPQPSAQANSTYVGASNCQMCHSEKHKSWMTKSHARAFELLAAKKQEKNEACLKCHTTGYGRGGYVDAEKTPALKGIGCEACHGPGSDHNGDKAKITRVPPATVCTECHMKSSIH